MVFRVEGLGRSIKCFELRVRDVELMYYERARN